MYYYWTVAGDNEPWLRHLMSVHRQLGRAAEVYQAHDNSAGDQMAMLPRLAKRYGAASRVERIYFDEGGPLEAESLEEPTYAHNAYFGRRGRWGIFHVLRFEVGPGHDLPPPLVWDAKRASSTNAIKERDRDNRRNSPSRRLPAGGVPDAPLHPGYCAETSGQADEEICEEHAKGAVRLGTTPAGWPRGPIRSIDDCVAWCYEGCSNCHFISFSEQWNDCSWYTDCNLRALHSKVRGFVSRRVVPAGNATKGAGAAAGSSGRATARVREAEGA